MSANKDKIEDLKKKNDLKASACGICRGLSIPPPCKGHGGSGGGSGGGDDEEKTVDVTNKDTKLTTGDSPNIPTEADKQENETLAKNKQAREQLVKDYCGDRMVECDTPFFHVESNRLQGTIELKVKPGLSEAELDMKDNIVKMIKDSFDDFKQNLNDQGVNTDKMTISDSHHKLSIKMPDPKHFDAFVKHLSQHNLLPLKTTPSPGSRITKDDSSISYQTPLKTKPLNTKLEPK